MDLPARATPFDVTVIALVVGSTLLLTTALLGVVSIVTASEVGYGARVPVYVLGGSVLFLVLVFRFERRGLDGRTIILSTVGLGLLGTLFLSLVGEGAVYAVSYPDRVLASQLVLYLLAAGAVCTGLAHWGLNHWREFVAT